MTMTAMVSRSCTSPIAMWFPSKNFGSGHPHIIWPMEKYMSGIKRRTELTRRRFMTGVSLSFSISSYSAVEADCDVLPFSPFFDAP